MELEIQKYLREHGLAKTVADLKLIHKVKGDLNLFKYNQIESDYSIRAVQEARGLILDSSDDWNIVCYTFHKFFNMQEGFAHPLDWNTVRVYQKLDGSIIQMYHFRGAWHFATSGTIDGMTETTSGLKLFSELATETVQKCYGLTRDEFTSRFDQDYCYAFELCTPFNIVITQHKSYSLNLLGLRNKRTLQEEPIEQDKFDWLRRPKAYPLRDIAEIQKTFESMTWEEEGYIFCDAGFNRQKCKNPAYVSVHHLKSGLGPQYIMDVIKDNELSEFTVYFAERSEEAYELKRLYDELNATLQEVWDGRLSSGTGFETQKDFADVIQREVTRDFRNLFYGLRNGRVASVTDWLRAQDNKWLYLYLNDPVPVLAPA